jgi:hypothetical protein
MVLCTYVQGWPQRIIYGGLALDGANLGPSVLDAGSGPSALAPIKLLTFDARTACLALAQANLPPILTEHLLADLRHTMKRREADAR